LIKRAFSVRTYRYSFQQ